jgi:hypothetical protein
LPFLPATGIFVVSEKYAAAILYIAGNNGAAKRLVGILSAGDRTEKEKEKMLQKIQDGKALQEMPG